MQEKLNAAARKYKMEVVRSMARTIDIDEYELQVEDERALAYAAKQYAKEVPAGSAKILLTEKSRQLAVRCINKRVS